MKLKYELQKIGNGCGFFRYRMLEVGFPVVARESIPLTPWIESQPPYEPEERAWRKWLAN